MTTTLILVACWTCLFHVRYSNWRVAKVRRQWRAVSITNAKIAEEALWALANGVSLDAIAPTVSKLQTLAKQQLDSTT